MINNKKLKLYHKITIKTCIGMCCFASTAYANNLSFVGAKTHTVLTSNSRHLKTISLIRIKISNTAANKLNKISKQLTIASTASAYKSNPTLPSQHQNHINYVPVQDQGQHGTCATFATSAAIDATYHLTTSTSDSNGVSELCNLQLGLGLDAERADAAKTYPNVVPDYINSGWVGMSGADALSRIAKFGFITKQQQQTKSSAGQYICGPKLYPINDKNPATGTTPPTYLQYSNKNYLQDASWQSLFTAKQYPVDSNLAQAYLDKIKNTISQGMFVTIGFRIDDSVAGADANAGAVANYRVNNDTWAANTTIINDADKPISDGHEILITGYDDTACALYTENGTKTQQCGLFTLRNSWGNNAGNKGNYYMTYKYFELMTFEAEIINTATNKFY